MPLIFSIWSSLCFSFCCSPKYFVSKCVSWRHSHCVGPALVLPQHPSKFAREPRVLAHVSCWPVQWLRSNCVPCCSTLIRHCSATPPSALTTTPSTSLRMKRLPSTGVVSRGIHWRQRQSVHRSSRCSPRLAGGTPARLVARGASIVGYVSGVRGLSVLPSRLPGCILRRRTRCQVCLMRSVPVLLTPCDSLSCPSNSSSSWSSGAFGFADWTRLWTRRVKAKLCHCKVCMSRVCPPRQSSVTENHTAVQHSCFAVVTRTPSGPSHQLEIPVQFL